ncbi:hypothetical protein EVAR_86982_1 [Eumeta japonica]|uniref:Uncharacterized protein n=1 Tax=Eumeta variegata TaxID=151549 RepID=A0A4C1W8A1_EUMVA|nr:hypothetical protein EVAR_86982_1 [Eumeta japonica]
MLIGVDGSLGESDRYSAALRQYECFQRRHGRMTYIDDKVLQRTGGSRCRDASGPRNEELRGGAEADRARALRELRRAEISTAQFKKYLKNSM